MKVQHYKKSNREVLVKGSYSAGTAVRAGAELDLPLRQVKFECSEEFYKRLTDEKLQRNLTIQHLVTRSLERYFALPESVHRGIEEEAQMESVPLCDVLRRRFINGKAGPKKRLAAKERRVFVSGTLDADHLSGLQAVLHYLEQLPTEKVGLVRESLALDLKYYRTSRFKAGGTSSEPLRG